MPLSSDNICIKFISRYPIQLQQMNLKNLSLKCDFENRKETRVKSSSDDAVSKSVKTWLGPGNIIRTWKIMVDSNWIPFIHSSSLVSGWLNQLKSGWREGIMNDEKWVWMCISVMLCNLPEADLSVISLSLSLSSVPFLGVWIQNLCISKIFTLWTFFHSIHWAERSSLKLLFRFLLPFCSLSSWLTWVSFILKQPVLEETVEVHSDKKEKRRRKRNNLPSFARSPPSLVFLLAYISNSSRRLDLGLDAIVASFSSPFSQVPSWRLRVILS